VNELDAETRGKRRQTGQRSTLDTHIVTYDAQTTHPAACIPVSRGAACATSGSQQWARAEKPTAKKDRQATGHKLHAFTQSQT
jgi:hypothetical protein